MAFGAGFFGGVSAAPGGYLDAKKEMADTDVRRSQATEAQNDVMGQAAFGRALQLMFGGGGAQGPQVPGQPPGGAGAPPGMTPPRPPGNIPQPPTGAPQGAPPGGPGAQPLSTEQLTGQQSPMGGVSNSRFNQTFMQPLIPPQQAPAMQPQGQPGGPPGGTMTGGPQPPQGPSGPPGAPPPGGQPQPGQGQTQPQLSLESVMQAMVRANPGAPPSVIAAGVNRFLPLMSAQSQQQWKEISLQLRQQSLENAQSRFDTSEGRRERQGGERTEDRRRGLDIRERGEERRGAESSSRQVDRTARTDLATQREARQGREGESRAADRDKRTGLMGAKEERQAAESKERLSLIKEKVTAAQAAAYTKKLETDAKIKKLNAEAENAERRGNIQEQRLKLQAMHARAAELINQWALDGKIDKATKAAVLEENRLLYRKIIEDIGKPKTEDAAPASGAPGAPSGGAPAKLRINPSSGQLEGLPAGAQ